MFCFSRRTFLTAVGSLILPASKAITTSEVAFVDVAQSAGLTATNINGGERTKQYIIESTGSGIAFFDYNNDGYADIFMVNGSRLEGFPPGDEPTNHLYRNNGNGTFTDVTQKVGLVHAGWGQGVCVGDYDNDGWLDLFVTYYGKNILYHNNRGQSFTDVTDYAGITTKDERNYSTGCAFVDYDRDGWLDLFVSNYADFSIHDTPPLGSDPNCRWMGIPVFCGPKGLPLSRNRLFHNNRDGTFTDVSDRAGITEGNRGYGFSVLTADGRTFTSPAIPHLACITATTRTVRFRRLAWKLALRSVIMDLRRQAWGCRQEISTTTDFLISSKPILLMTHQISIATTATVHLTMSSIRQ